MEKDFVVAQRLSALLADRGLSERKISLDLGHADSYINKITSGRVKLSIDELLYICEYLHISPAQFFSEEDLSPTEFVLLTKIQGLPEDDLLFLINTVEHLKKKNQSNRK